MVERTEYFAFTKGARHPSHQIATSQDVDKYAQYHTYFRITKPYYARYKR